MISRLNLDTTIVSQSNVILCHIDLAFYKLYRVRDVFNVGLLGFRPSLLLQLVDEIILFPIEMLYKVHFEQPPRLCG